MFVSTGSANITSLCKNIVKISSIHYTKHHSNTSASVILFAATQW